MNASQRQWVWVGLVVVVTFLAAVNMRIARLTGWGFLFLCLIVGLVGGLSALWVRAESRSAWNRLTKKQRIYLVAAVVALIVVASVLSHHWNVNEIALDVMWLVFGLLLWGCYRLFSRSLDSLWNHFKK